MQQNKLMISGAFVLASTWLGANVAEAQSQPATMAAVTASGAPELAKTKEDEVEDEGSKNPMAWIGIGVKAGVASMGASESNVQGYKASTESRMGMQLSMPINMGGGGAGFVIEPLLTSSSVDHATKDASGTINGTESVSLLGLGAYLGPTFNIHIMDPLYVGFGFGLRGTYMLNDAYDLAAEIGGRVPVTATYYVTKAVAVVGEVGLGYGGSLFADKPAAKIDPLTGDVTNMKDDPSFGLAFAWDASIGARFP